MLRPRPLAACAESCCPPDIDAVPLHFATYLERDVAELATEMATNALSRAQPTMNMPITNAAFGEAQSRIRFGAGVTTYLVEGARSRRSAPLPRRVPLFC